MSGKKSYLVILFVLFCASALSAQTSWRAERVDGSGDLVTVFFTSSDKGFVAGDNGYLGFTGNGGRSWTKQSINTKENITEIYFRNDDNGYLVAGKDLFITRDGGRTWQKNVIVSESAFKGNVPEFLSIRFADKKLGIVVGSLLNKSGRVVDSLVLRTNNGGENWTRIAVPSKKELFHLEFVDDSRGWIVGDDGLILVTDDSGLNWRVQKSGTTKALYNVDFRDEDNGFAVGEDGIILRTENGGQFWETIKTSFPATFLRVDFADEKNGWIVGFGGTILRSSDRGRTWIRQESSTKENLYGLFMTKKYGWAVGSKGLIAGYQK